MQDLVLNEPRKCCINREFLFTAAPPTTFHKHILPLCQACLLCVGNPASIWLLTCVCMHVHELAGMQVWIFLLIFFLWPKHAAQFCSRFSPLTTVKWKQWNTDQCSCCLPAGCVVMTENPICEKLFFMLVLSCTRQQTL